MKITKATAADGGTFYIVDELDALCTTGLDQLLTKCGSIRLTTDQLARLSMLGAEILMADPAVAFVAG